MKIEVRHEKLLGLELELLILHEMVSDKYRLMHMSGVLTWVFHIFSLEILHPIHKLDIPVWM